MIYRMIKMCNFEGCETRASYAFSNQDMTRCHKHRQEGMINKTFRKCKKPECQIVASYGIDNRRDYCAQHRTEDMKYYDYKRKRTESFEDSMEEYEPKFKKFKQE